MDRMEVSPVLCRARFLKGKDTYSQRNVTAGSTSAARLAGKKLAITEVVNSICPAMRFCCSETNMSWKAQPVKRSLEVTCDSVASTDWVAGSTTEKMVPRPGRLRSLILP
jgi:hypothetical protein